MTREITVDEVVRAARDLDRGEFTETDVAAKLGVRRRKLKEGFGTARRLGRLERVRTDGSGTRHFRLADRRATPAAASRIQPSERTAARPVGAPESSTARLARESCYLDIAVHRLSSPPGE